MQEVHTKKACKGCARSRFYVREESPVEGGGSYSSEAEDRGGSDEAEGRGGGRITRCSCGRTCFTRNTFQRAMACSKRSMSYTSSLCRRQWSCRAMYRCWIAFVPNCIPKARTSQSCTTLLLNPHKFTRILEGKGDWQVWTTQSFAQTPLGGSHMRY